MEHQVFVPVPTADLRGVLRDPARLARCVPGFQQDADEASGPLSGRLKLRVGGSTVTYRGALTVTERDEDVFEAGAEGAEVRGTGSVKVTLALRLTPRDGGTLLDFTAGGGADGRAAAFPAGATVTAVRRLLDRACANLATTITAPAAVEPDAPGGQDAPGAERGAPGQPNGAPGQQDALGEQDVPGEQDVAGEQDASGEDGPTGPEIIEVSASLFDAEVPPPSLDPFAEREFGEFGDLGDTPRPPAEAAHARRTMIGRSAEEVDHAPPRGRYAPVPAPEGGVQALNLRWLAPAAALALASAVVVGRALRRRR
ncbi:SRPBCC domain-containing protein [Streptomyces sp. G-G2]|uniref:SRPBCC domain-containing protein n=1 Tax=Streptomyces sp. G-G2 TaxID=3046201 RepID=UPI0024BA9017|nr:SRPBCC domain-containing protein [Streptomyces sp. G-G2]MDJ0382536.1 SRPBCC domain-containing protein [Streptomyces sp. G-G2]